MKHAKFDKFLEENPWVGWHFNAEEEERSVWIERLDYIAFRPFETLCLDGRSSIKTSYRFLPHFSLVPEFMPWEIKRYGIWFHSEGERFTERSITVGFERKEETIRDVMELLIQKNTPDVVVRIREAGDSKLMMFANSVEIFRVPLNFQM